MKFLQGKDRHQVQFETRCLDETIEANNEVRNIDAFVEALDFDSLGFRIDYKETGRPAYHPSDLLKLFIYGYMHRCRSSRQLEAECRRNLEVMWLLKGLTPDHNTINRFRKEHSAAIRMVFKHTVEVAKHHQLIGGTLLAGDSTKLRAQNSKKNNFNQKKIDRHVAYIDRKLEEYTELLDDEDGEVPQELKQEAQEKMAQHKANRKVYEALSQQIAESGEEQISTSDPDSKQMIIRGQITEVAYNVQSTVDEKHNLPIDFEVTNHNDSKAMGEMVERAAEILNTSDFTMLLDKGYHTTSEFEKVEAVGAEVIVAYPAASNHAPNEQFDVANFVYNPKKDRYRCPAGAILRSNGSWYHNRDRSGRFKQYKTTKCKECLFVHSCTKSKSGRVIQRTERADLIEKNKEKLDSNKQLYRKRQAIVEHPFGTIKRQWGFDHVLTKRFKKNATADVGLIFIAYNLRRIINILSAQHPNKAGHKGLLDLFHRLIKRVIHHIFIKQPISVHYHTFSAFCCGI